MKNPAIFLVLFLSFISIVNADVVPATRAQMDETLTVEDTMDMQRMTAFGTPQPNWVQNYCVALSGASGSNHKGFRIIEKSKDCNPELVTKITAAFCEKWPKAPYHIVKFDCREKDGKPVDGGCQLMDDGPAIYCKKKKGFLPLF